MPASERLAGAPAAHAAGAPAQPVRDDPSPDHGVGTPVPAAVDLIVTEMADAEPQLRRMLLYKFGISHHNAEDVLAGVRERWLRSLQQGSDMPQHPRGYLFALTRNGAVDHLRKASSKHEVPTSDADWNALESMLDQVRSAEDVVTASLLNEQLLAKVQSLPHVQRRVIECLFLKDMTPRETAQRLAISVDSVNRSRLRALKTLRNMYVHAASESADDF